MWELFLLSALIGFVTGVGAHLSLLLAYHMQGGAHVPHPR